MAEGTGANCPADVTELTGDCADHVAAKSASALLQRPDEIFAWHESLVAQEKSQVSGDLPWQASVVEPWRRAAARRRSAALT